MTTCDYRPAETPNWVCTRPTHDDGTTHIYAWRPEGEVTA